MRPYSSCALSARFAAARASATTTRWRVSRRPPEVIRPGIAAPGTYQGYGCLTLGLTLATLRPNLMTVFAVVAATFLSTLAGGVFALRSTKQLGLIIALGAG